MAYKQKRHIVRFGASSKGIVLPKGWLEFYSLREGDHVVILGNSVLLVARPEDERNARKVLRAIEGAGIEK